MPIYRFYPCQADGCADSWLRADHPDDRAALTYARGLLAGHPTATMIIILEGEREVGAVKASPVTYDARVLDEAKARIEASRRLLASTAHAVQGGQLAEEG